MRLLDGFHASAVEFHASAVEEGTNMTRRFDFAQATYWRAEFIEPIDPDDDRYVFLHGEEGEIVGPLTVRQAEAWLDRFSAACSPCTPAANPPRGTSTVRRNR